MDLKRLAHLVALEEERSFSRAAARVNLSQPAFSRSIQAAEAEMGLTLFERGSNDVACTPAGRFVVERARRVLADSRSLEVDIALYRTRRIGDLRIGMSPQAGVMFLPELLGEIRNRYPEVNCAVEVSSSQQVLSQLQNEKLDIAVMWTALAASFDSLVTRPLTTITLAFFVRAGHPVLARARPVWTDIAEFGIATVGIMTDGREFAARGMGLQSGEQIPIRLNCDDLTYLKHATLTSNLVLGISLQAVAREVEAGTLCPVVPTDVQMPTATLGIITYKGRTLSPLSEFVADHLIAQAGRLPASG